MRKICTERNNDNTNTNRDTNTMTMTIQIHIIQEINKNILNKTNHLEKLQNTDVTFYPILDILI